MTRLCGAFGLAMLALIIGAPAYAEDFIVGGYALSDYISVVTTDGWDETGASWSRKVSKDSDEPLHQYSVAVSRGKLNEPPTETHKLSVLATDGGKAYLIDFDGALDSKKNADSPDFLESCAAGVAKLGGPTRTARGYSIIVDRDMQPAAKARTFAAIDKWVSKPFRRVDLTRSLRFKGLAAALGRDFRGAIVVCSEFRDFEGRTTRTWETRFLDLPLAATVFNLDPE